MHIMTRTMLFVLVGIVCVLPARLHAQQEAATKEQLEEVKGALDALTESSTTYQGYVDALRKIKVTGYLQPQFRYTDVVNQVYSIGAFSGGAFPSNTKNMFQIRRGRLKVTYDNVLTQFVIQIDAIQTGFTTKDAYLSIIEPWTKSLGFQMGIFDRPFGYEISYSSSNRETPERSRLFQTIFPGERELGAKLFYAPQMGPLSFMRADIGIFNGSGPTANEFDNFKDVIGHVAAQFPFEQANAEVDLGISGYFGNVRNATKDLFEMGDLPAGGKGFIKTSDTTFFGDGVTRQYVGADMQFYYDIPSLGGMILRGEYITGKQPGSNASTSSPAAQITTAIYKREFSGWYAYYIQNIGDHEQIVFKYDVYDPNTKVEASDFTPASGLTPADIKFSTLGLGFIHHWDDNVKFILYYELVQNEKLEPAKATSASLSPYTDDVRDNVFTFRVQYKF